MSLHSSLLTHFVIPTFPTLPLDSLLRLRSCVEEIQNVLGDSLPEWSVIDAVVTHGFDFEKSLDYLLRQQQGGGDDDEDEEEEQAFGVSATNSASASFAVDAPAPPRLFPSSRLSLVPHSLCSRHCLFPTVILFRCAVASL